jgi:hypothetical protein
MKMFPTRRKLQSASRIAAELLIAGAILIASTTTGLRSGSAQEGPQSAGPSTVAAGAFADRSSEQKLARAKESGETKDAGAQDSAVTPNAVEVASAANYVFSSTTGVALEDLSIGATQVIGTGDDDAASAPFNFGFDFYFMGIGYSQGSPSPDGFLKLGPGTAVDQFTNSLTSTTNIPKIAPEWDDHATGTTGNVKFKVIGAAPNRKLVVQWFVTVPRATGGAANATYQLWLFETTGVIQFVYGAIAADATNSGYSVGFTSSATQFASVTTATDTNSFVAANNTQTTAISSGKSYLYTPPAITGSAPSGLNFTAVAPTSLTLNWTDNSTNEAGFPIYISSDGGTTYTLNSVAPENAVSANISGLNPSTLYFFRVYAVTEGNITLAFTQNSVTTAAPGNISSTAAGGNWSAPATWVGGVVPTSSDNVTIVSGATVTIDSSNAFSVTVQSGGVLQYEATTARTLTVITSVTIDSGGTFQSNAAGTQTGHVLSIGTNLTNNGTLDFSTNTNTAGAGITFTGAANNTFSGTGATTDVRTITVNKGTSFTPILELTTTNFTVQGVNTNVPAGFLTLTNGTFKLSGSFTGTNRVFPSPTYTIPATTGFWLNNPNYTVVGQVGGGTTSTNGMLRVSQGIYGVGVGAGDQMRGGAGAVFIIEGTGTLNCSGAFDPQSGVNYTQTGGTVNVAMVGNNVSLFGSFELFSSASTFTMSGGTINVIQPSSGATKVDYDILSNVVNITGGLLVIGAAPAAAGSTYNIQGWTPNLTINTGMNVVITTNANSTFPLVVGGSSLINNGAITGAAATYVDFASLMGPMTYSGTGTLGTLATPVSAVGLDTGSPVTVTSPIVTLRVNLFQGTFIGSGLITLGNAGASATTIQVGFTNSPVPGGTFDVTPIHNQGSGGQSMLHGQTTPAYTTGFEINPTRTLTSMLVVNPNNVNLSGGDLTITGATTLTSGRFITGANNLVVGSAGTVARTTGYVDGNFKKNLTATGSKLYEVGTANGYSPFTLNVTTIGAPTTFTAKATQGPQPSVNAATSIQRYWTLTSGGGITGDLTFQYLAGDVMGTEANYRVIRVVGTTPVSFPTSVVTPATHVATLAGVSSFSDWTVGENAFPTAANSSISGVVTRADGQPLGGVSVNLSGSQAARTITNSQGQYRFINLETDGFYTVTPGLANYSFSPSSRSFALLGNRTDAGFTASADGTQTENPLNVGDFFVRQQYLDFLGREPDQQGWLFWTEQLNQCGIDANCIRQKRIDISAAFFQSDEFQLGGNYVYRMYRAALGRRLTYAEFSEDRQQVVGGPGLDASRIAFADSFVGRPEFVQKYQNISSGEVFVDALLQTVQQDAGLELSSQREALIQTYNAGADTNQSRSAVLRAVAESSAFKGAVYNASFVLTEYFGYLQRGPDADGYNFWVEVLNHRDPGNYRGMVCSFLTSTEYQQRFSSVVIHGNNECGR